ncbi:MAG TPA: DUF4336 domain-containing protein [Kofleriaceae bacterium]|nr:DUF4336 domain-containing protein [Kofleriaceae bacterium]
MQSIGTDIWHLQGRSLRMPGGVALPVASTVVRLPDRSLVLYSPIDFDDATAAEVDALGEVAHVIAPSRLHHMFAGAAARRWPRAQVHAAPGVRDKQPALRVDHELVARATGVGNDAGLRNGAAPDSDMPPPARSVAAWSGVLELQHIAGAPSIDEHVAFHRPSGTLICSDLLFHITRPANLRTRIMLALMGVGGGRLAQSRVWRFARRDRDAARASVERVLSWPIAQIAPCHGEPCPVDVAALAPRLTRLARIRSVPALAAP